MESAKNVRSLCYIGMCAAIMAACSWITIPTTVPFTLQTFAVFLSVALLGGKRGTAAVGVYLLLGLIGLPVFAGFTGGVSAFLTPSGGYLIGFIGTALVMWGFERLLGRSVWALALAMAVGLLVCYAFGTGWFMYIYTRETGPVGLWTVLSWCVFPFLLPDAGKIVLALVLARRLSPVMQQHN